MSKYHKHGIHLSEKQLHSLSHGKKVIVKHEHLQGSHHIHLTKTQLTKLHKHHREGKNFPLQLSHTQLKYHEKHGEGFFGDLVRKVKHGISRVGEFLTPHLKNLGHSLVEHGAEHAKEYAHNKISEYGRTQGPPGKKKEEKKEQSEEKVPQPTGPPVMSAPVVKTNQIPVAPPIVSSKPSTKDLLSQIREGKKLKPSVSSVPSVPTAPPMVHVSKPKTQGSAKADLLSQIREGTKLKKAGANNKMEVKKQDFAKDTKVDPMDDLRRRLAVRRSKLRGDGIKRRKRGKGLEDFLPLLSFL